MGQEVVVPDWAKKGASQAFASLNAQDDNLSEGIGQSYPVIRYKGKVWSFRYRGENKTFIRPDDGTPASYLDVIILGQAKQKSKSYYKAYDPSQGDGERPICSSIDGITPDPDVTTKQADVCALCPRNVWKTDPATGRKGRDCTDYKRIAVLVLPTLTTPLYGAPVMEAAFLRIPPASLNALAIMGDTMSRQGFHYSSYITRITFEPTEAHPKMVFTPLQGLSDQEAPVVLQMREDAQVGRIIHGGYAEGIQNVPPQENTTLVLPPPPATVGLVTAPVTQAPLQQTTGQQTTGQQTTGQQPLTVPPPTQITGLGLVIDNPPQPTVTLAAQVVQPTPPVTADAAEASDADLDDQIAALIGGKK